MTNSKKLKEIFVSNGMTQNQVAKILGISGSGLSRKVGNKLDFKASEINKLCDIFEIRERENIFFG